MEWLIGPILPNIEISDSFDTKYVSIAPMNDIRVKKIVNSDENINKYFDLFINEHGKKVSPSMIIYSKKLPNYLMKKNIISDSIVALRNIYAISCLLNYYQKQLQWIPKFSDYFDFYHLLINPNKTEMLYGSNIALREMTDTNIIKYCFVNPNIAGGQTKTSIDYELAKHLKKIWIERFERRKNNSKIQAFFRSIEMAYHAMSLFDKNNGSIYDYGSRLALWVSAFEILSPSFKGFESVINLLDKYQFKNSNNKKCRKKIYTICRNGKNNKVDYLTKIYYKTYTARNDFLHGNNVKKTQLFYNKIFILDIIPIVYEIAILAYLKQNNLLTYKNIYEETVHKNNLEIALFPQYFHI